MGLSPRDLVLPVGCAILGVISAIALAAKGPEPAVLAGVAMFGGGAVFTSWLVLERMRFDAQIASPAAVGVVGGVPIRLNRRRFVAGGLWLGAIGVALLPVAPQRVDIGVCALLLVGAGGALVAGLLPRGADRWLQFEPEGLRVGDARGSALVPWDAIAAARVYEVQRNLQLLIRFDVGRVEGDVLSLVPWGPPGQLSLQPAAFGLDPARLGQAIARYVVAREARDELRPRRGLPG